MIGARKGLLLIAVMALVLLCSLANAISIEPNNIKDIEEQLAPRSKYVTVPNNGLTRFLFYNTRPIDRSANGLIGYKRSSSNLDALSGMTLGKRSSAEYINMEPLFGRHYGSRSVPRMYDLRWAPLDSYETPVASADYN